MSMMILNVVYVSDMLWCRKRHGGVWCGEVVNRKLDGDFNAGVCKGYLWSPVRQTKFAELIVKRL